MSNPDLIQLGCIFLRSTFVLPRLNVSEWSTLTPSFLESHESFESSSSGHVKTLRDAMDDIGLGFQGEWIRDNDELVRVRCWMLPSDAPGSMWKSVRNRYRGKTLNHLMKAVRLSWEVEEGRGKELMGRSDEDSQSMLDIYASIPSPPEPKFEHAEVTTDQELYDSLEAFENPPGIKTNLYRYQIRSVAKMIKMEMQPHRLVDPLFIPMKEAGRDGTYYVNLGKWDIQRSPGWYELPRGGILCEQMGTGKTLMCLSVITSTLHQPTRPPSNPVGTSSVTTDYAERTYPFDTYSDLRALTGYSSKRLSLHLPSLANLCYNLLTIHDPASRPTLPSISHQDRRPLYYELPIQDECPRGVKRQAAEIRKVWLARGTLVVVPSILIPQWKTEIEQHLQEGVLKILFVTEAELPRIQELLKYDVIMMDVERFGREETQHRRQLDKPLPPSVLLQAKWKRIILDEGHTAHSKTSNYMTFATQLNVERRWLVSGTPTRHLQQGGGVDIASVAESHSQPFRPHNSVQGVERPHQWSARDIEDATRIGKMIGGFLAAEPFKSDVGFQREVTAKLRGKLGPSFGAVRMMKDIVAEVMVKHEPKQINREAMLPSSTIVDEIIHFDPWQRITYNALAALVSSNVYTSGGEDADYFLHPKNRESFNQVVQNLHLACFWYSAPEMGVEDCLARTTHWLDNHEDAEESVRRQLKEACKHLRTALETPGWNEWMTNGISMPLQGHFLPSAVKQGWSDSFNTQQDAVDVHSFLLLRQLNSRGNGVHDLHMEGWDYRQTKVPPEFVKLMEQNAEKHAKEQNSEKRAMEQKVKAKGKGSTAAQAPKAAPKITKTGESDKGRKRKRDEIDGKLDEAALNAAASAAASVDLSALDHTQARPLPSVVHTRSYSAKANFVIRTILAADKEDKFVIFGDAYELGHLSEMLEMVDITVAYVGKGSGISVNDRRAALDEFQKPSVRVCLLDLKVGARGLNLVVANRVIFLQPVWNPDVQAQAIKRVHRIGQTKPTKIQILVTKGTFEEDIANRSNRSSTDTEEQVYSRAMIENPRFVHAERDSTETFAVRFTPTGEPKTTPMTPDSSNIPTPTEVYPLTPLAKSAEGVTGVTIPSASSPTTDVMSSDLMFGKRGLGEAAANDKKEKKRARVAFA